MTPFLHHLQQPEYVHVLLNPAPLYGMAMGVFALGAAILARSRASRIIGLLMIALVSIVTWLAYRYGHRGYDRIYAMSGQDAQLWLDVHRHRASLMSGLFIAAALGSVASLLSEVRFPRFAPALVALTLAVSLLAAASAAWISQAGGQIRHSEFRDGPP